MSTNLELKGGRYYRRRDGLVVGPLRPTQRFRNRGIIWKTERPVAGYYADGRCSHAGCERHDLIEEIDDVNALDPNEFPVKCRKSAKPQPAEKKEVAANPSGVSTHRLVMDGVTIKVVISGSTVQILGVDKPFSTKAVGALTELLMEVM